MNAKFVKLITRKNLLVYRVHKGTEWASSLFTPKAYQPAAATCRQYIESITFNLAQRKDINY